MAALYWQRERGYTAACKSRPACNGSVWLGATMKSYSGPPMTLGNAAAASGR